MQGHKKLKQQRSATNQLVKKKPIKKYVYKLTLKMYDNIPKYNKDDFIKNVKENQPEFYIFNEFQNWIKK